MVVPLSIRDSKTSKWILKYLDNATLQTLLQSKRHINADELVDTLTAAWNQQPLAQRAVTSRRSPVYWWIQEIGELRRALGLDVRIQEEFTRIRQRNSRSKLYTGQKKIKGGNKNIQVYVLEEAYGIDDDILGKEVLDCIQASKIDELFVAPEKTKAKKSPGVNRIQDEITKIAVTETPDIFLRSDALQIQRIRRTLESVFKKLAIQVCQAYRTVSADAVMVIADMRPIYLMAKERIERYGNLDEPSRQRQHKIYLLAEQEVTIYEVKLEQGTTTIWIDRKYIR
nr:unnamed protein product [Callosobruchus analis]